MNSSDSFTNLEFRIYEFIQQIFIMISLSTGKLRKKECFGPIRNLFSFFKFQLLELRKNLGKNW